VHEKGRLCLRRPVSLIRLCLLTARVFSACGLTRVKGERTHPGWLARNIW